MADIGLRIEEFRKAKNLKKVDLANTAHLSAAAITLLCNGTNDPSNQTVSMLCDAYGVNKTWLLTGKGSMFEPSNRKDEIADIVQRLYRADNDSKTALIKCLADMSDEQIEAFTDFVRKFYETIQDNKKST